jgi:hypothetical protein
MHIENEDKDKKDLINELKTIKSQNSNLLNENKILNNDLFLINQKLLINTDMYKTLKLSFDETEKK